MSDNVPQEQLVPCIWVPKMFLQWKKSLVAVGSLRPLPAAIVRYRGVYADVRDVISVLSEFASQLAKPPPTWERHQEQGACYLTKPLGLFYPVRVMLLDAQTKNVWQKCGVDIIQQDGFTVHAWKLKCWFRLTKILAGLRKQL